MGCDIHLYREKQVGGRWVAADEWVEDSYEPGRKEVPFSKRFHERNYELFGVLARGVRSDHPFSFTPRGLPLDPCAEVSEASANWDGDGHSHSYLYLHELRDLFAFAQSATVKVSGMKDAAGMAALNESIASGAPNWDLLFPYAGWMSSPDAVEFSLDVPAHFYFGDAIKRIIDSFDGTDGDNHRVVFWFDN